MSEREKIRDLNDRFRTTFSGGIVTVTSGVAARDDAAMILERVKIFDAFDTDNDPHGEHDFGAIGVGCEKVFWKIDYYDIDLKSGSADPTDQSLTTRVLTIMLAKEY